MKTTAALVLLLTPVGALLTRSFVASPSQPANATAVGVQIQHLRTKLTKLSGALKLMLNSLSKMDDVGPSVQTFCSQVEEVLKKTQEKQDMATLRELQAVSKGAQDVAKNLMSKQMQLMSEDKEDKELGASIDAQLAVLKSQDFAMLGVVKAILAKKDATTPLSKQITAYLHEHPYGLASNNSGGHAVRDVSDVISAFQAQLHQLEASAEHAKKLQDNITKSYDVTEKREAQKAPKRAHTVHLIRKKEERKFAKVMAMRRKDVESMKDAISALKKGDIQALGRAASALESSVKSMQSHNGGFLVLVQESFREAGMDCPFCAAQCVDKCHEAGKPYVTCLTDCADAGKS